MCIAIVGPCAAGKTTLAKKLCAMGLDAREVAQEHSLVPTMWLQITKPDTLIYLDVSLETIHRRLSVDWEGEYLDRLVARLSDAREHADFVLDTNNLSQAEVAERVLRFLWK